MHKLRHQKIVLALSALFFVAVFFGFGAHAKAATYADTRDSGWTFWVDGSPHDINEKNFDIIIANKNEAGQDQYSVFAYEKTKSGGVREYVQRQDYFGHAGDTRDCPQHIDVGLDHTTLWWQRNGCNSQWVKNGIELKADIPADILEKADLENMGDEPLGCPGFSALPPGAPETDRNYNCPNGKGSVQKGVYTENAVIEPVATVATPDDASAKTKCDALSYNPLKWAVCPMINGAYLVIAVLDVTINRLLTVDVNAIFDTSQDPGKQYYEVWATFRNIALGLVVIAALVVIIASAFGFEILDAYTIKVALPRVFIAVIGIALSWQILEFLIILTNDIGNGVRAIIYAPFASDLTGPTASNSTLFISNLLFGGGLIALGFMGLATFVFGAAIAAALAFLILVVREMIIVLLVLIAPVAIAMIILPNTRKGWELWQKTLTSMLIAFPIISAFIAMGRVFALIAVQGGGAAGPSVINQMIGFIAYFLPYFMIPFAFRMAGGVMATISGISNDKSRGVFDRMKKGRQNRMSQNMSDLKSGQRIKSENVFARGFNSSSQHLGAIPSAGFNPLRMRNRMQSSLSNSSMTDAEKFLKESHEMQAISGNDDFLQAGIIGRGNDSRVREYLVNHGYNAETAEQGVAAIRAARRKAPGDVFDTAAALALPQTGTAFRAQYDAAGNVIGGGAGEMHDLINRVAGGDRVKASRMLATMRSGAQQGRRFDLAGGGYGDQLAEMEAQFSGARSAADATVNIMNQSLEGQGGSAIVGGRSHSVRALAPIVYRRLQAAAGSGDPQELSREIAAVAGRYDAMASVSPENARIFANDVMSRTDLLGDGRSVQEIIESYRGNQEFLQMRREYATAGAAAAAGAMGGTPAPAPTGATGAGGPP